MGERLSFDADYTLMKVVGYGSKSGYLAITVFPSVRISGIRVRHRDLCARAKKIVRRVAQTVRMASKQVVQ